jgi:hypothetical protein
MVKKSLHMHSFLQQKDPVTEATPQTKPLLQRRSSVFWPLRVSPPSQSLSFEHSALHSEVVSTVSALLMSRAGRRQMRLGHSSAWLFTMAWLGAPIADSSQTRPMALSSQPDAPSTAGTNRASNAVIRCGPEAKPREAKPRPKRRKVGPAIIKAPLDVVGGM